MDIFRIVRDEEFFFNFEEERSIDFNGRKICLTNKIGICLLEGEIIIKNVTHGLGEDMIPTSTNIQLVPSSKVSSF